MSLHDIGGEPSVAETQEIEEVVSIERLIVGKTERGATAINAQQQDHQQHQLMENKGLLRADEQRQQEEEEEVDREEEEEEYDDDVDFMEDSHLGGQKPERRAWSRKEDEAIARLVSFVCVTHTRAIFYFVIRFGV